MNPRPESLGRLLRFGPFELDTKAGELSKHGISLRLQEQPFRLLVCLLENPGAVVSRDELARRIWADGTFVDYEHGLNAAVTRLRQVLRDSAENPRYIETVARRGYRFIAPVNEISGAELEEAPGQVPQTAPVKRKGPAWIYLLLAGLAVLALAVFLFRLQQRPQGPPVYPALPFTTYAGSELSPSFAPDGERVAFSWDGENQDNFDIYVKQIGVGASARLTTDSRPDLSPAWSPDGRNIAFLRVIAEDKAEVLLVPSLMGGAERHIGEVALLLQGSYKRLRLLSWSADGKWLIVPESSALGAPIGLSLLAVETGETRRLTDSRGYNDLCPALSPDSKRLVFTRYSGSVTSDLYLLDLTGDLSPLGQPKRLTFDHHHIGNSAWTPDGRAILFTRFAFAGLPSLWRLTPGMHLQEEPLPVSAGDVSTLTASPKGDRLVFAREMGIGNIWGVELSSSGLHTNQNTVPKPWITSSSSGSTLPQFSPDGRQIAFASDRSGWGEIWIADRDGSHPRQLTNVKGVVVGFPHWSPDGTRIVFHLRQQSEASLFAVSVSNGRTKRLPYEAGNDFTPTWSHDGKWIYFSSRRTGDIQVWKIPAEGGSATRVTRHGGSVPTESADGKNLFYTKSYGAGSIWSLPLAGGEERQIVSDVATDGTAYAVGRNGIYFIRKVPNVAVQQLAFLNLATGELRAFAEISSPVGLGLAISSDERIFLYTQVDHPGSDLMLVENFH